MSSRLSTISIVIPARNEERELPQCLAAIAYAESVAGVKVEKIVVINRCTDDTERIATENGCIIVREDAKNLSKIRNAGVRASHGDWVITIDADSRMSPTMLLEVRKKLSDLRIIGGGVLIKPARYSLGILATGLVLLPLIVVERLSGGMFWFRRADFEAIKGFNEDFVSVEDIDFARRLKAHAKLSGRKFATIWRAAIITSCRKFDTFGDWYFLQNPRELIALFRGRDQKAADKIWYDYNDR